MYLFTGQTCSCINYATSLNAYNISYSNKCPSTNPSCTLWAVYVASHVQLNYNQNNIGLLVQKINLMDPIEVGSPVALQISVNLNNTRLYVDFDDGFTKSFINSGYAVHEYQNPGSNDINVTAVCLSNTLVTDTTTIQIKVVKRLDQSAMESIDIRVKESNDLQVGVKIIANGGAPFACNVTYGESARVENFQSQNRTFVHSTSRQYPTPGLYNITAYCRSDQNKDIIIGDWKLVYIPDASISSAYKDPKYSFDNLNYIYVERKSQKLPDEIDLVLPFKSVPASLRFDIIDLYNHANGFAYINAKRSSSTTANYIIKLSSGYLIKDKSFFMVKTNDIYLATYVVTIQDRIDIAPQISLKTSPIKISENEAGQFTLFLPQTYPYSILRFEYGDGAFEIFDIDDSQKGVTLDFEHRYSKVGAYVAIATMGNYISSIQTTFKVPFELKLAEFQLTHKGNVTDVSEEVTFQLKKLGDKVSTTVDTISFKEDENDMADSSILLQNNYAFTAANQFSFIFSYKFKKVGLYRPTFTIVSMAGTVEVKVVVKVGADLDGVTAFVFNNYASITDSVKVYVRVDSGNGYDVTVKFSDTEVMVIPWAYINSNGAMNTNTIKLSTNQVKPNAQIVGKGVIYAIYQYSLPGTYSISVKVSNPFTSISRDTCAQTIVVPAYQAGTYNGCTLSNENAYVRLVEDINNTNDIKLAKVLN